MRTALSNVVVRKVGNAVDVYEVGRRQWKVGIRAR